MYIKTYYKVLCLVLGLSALTSIGYAQDLHFSQFQHAAILLSPTETGNYFGDWRVINNYRNQWAKIGRPITTAAVAFDRQIYFNNQKFSFGGQYVYDEGGDYLLVHQKFLLAAAYHQTVGHNTFRIGVQGGVVQKRLNSGGYSLPDQWDQQTGRFNSNLPTGEQLYRRIIYYPDFNIGASYRTKIWKLKPEATLSLFHINRPNESFFYEENKLKIRKAIFIRSLIKINKQWTLDPQFLYMWQNKSIDFVIGSYANYRLSSNFLKAQYAFAGISLRNSLIRNWDAFIFTGGLQFNRLRAAISYDVTVSQLRLANSYSGAVEVALIYTGFSSVLGKRAIPCNRL